MPGGTKFAHHMGWGEWGPVSPKCPCGVREKRGGVPEGHGAGWYAWGAYRMGCGEAQYEIILLTFFVRGYCNRAQSSPYSNHDHRDRRGNPAATMESNMTVHNIARVFT